MSRTFLVGLFVLIAFSMATLIKWEYKRFQRRQPAVTKAFRRHLKELRDHESGRAYIPPPARVKRAFEDQGEGRS